MGGETPVGCVEGEEEEKSAVAGSDRESALGMARHGMAWKGKEWYGSHCMERGHGRNGDTWVDEGRMQ